MKWFCFPKRSAWLGALATTSVLAMAVAVPGEREAREYLFDGCNDLDLMAPIFWQTAWNPKGFEGHRIGTLRIDNETSVQGSGCIAWTVTAEQLAEVRARETPPEFVMLNRLHGQDWGDVRQLRFHIHSENESQPPLFVQLVGHGEAPSKTILERGETTGGWREVRWDVTGLDLGEHEEYGTRLWYLRFGTRVDSIEEGDSLELRIDNIRFVVMLGNDVSDIPEEPALPPDEQFAVWPVHYAEKASIHSVPDAEGLDLSISIFATPGELEPASFSVRAVTAPLQDVRISLTEPLISPEGNTIASEHVEFRVVESMKRWLGPNRYVPEETYLVPAMGRDIDSGNTQRYWLTVNVPEAAEPGHYSSTIAVNSKGHEAQQLDLSLEVLPFRLEQIDDIAFFMYHSPHLFPEKFRSIEYQEQLYADMVDHGMTTVTAYFRPTGDILHGARSGYLPIAPVVQALRRAGLPAGELPLLWIGADSYGGDMWKPILDAVTSEGVADLLFYVVDEPSPARYPTVEAVMERIREFREASPEYKVRTVTALGPQAIKDVGHHYDIWILGGGSVREKMAAEAAAQDRQLWAYECHFSPTQPEISRYYFGLWAWKAGVRGVSYWAYYDGGFYSRFGNIGSFEDVDRDWLEWTNQFNFIYPTSEGPVPTLGWAATRQGVNDYRYLRTLEVAMEGARSDPAQADAVAAAESLLAEISGLIGVENYSQRPAGEFADRADADIFDRARPEAHLRPADYDRIRYRIAEAVMALTGT